MNVIIISALFQRNVLGVQHKRALYRALIYLAVQLIFVLDLEFRVNGTLYS